MKIASLISRLQQEMNLNLPKNDILDIPPYRSSVLTLRKYQHSKYASRTTEKMQRTSKRLLFLCLQGTKVLAQHHSREPDGHLLSHLHHLDHHSDVAVCTVSHLPQGDIYDLVTSNPSTARLTEGIAS